MCGYAIARRAVAKAIKEGTAIHPNYAQEVSAADGITVAWEKVPYSQGGWAEWKDEQREKAYQVLLQLNGPIFLAGEHLSYIVRMARGGLAVSFGGRSGNEG